MNTKQIFPPELVKDYNNKQGKLKVAFETAGVVLPEDPKVAVSCLKVISCSDFVYKNCVNHPEMFIELVTCGDLERRYCDNEYNTKLTSILNNVKINNENMLASVLRQFKIREMVRIAWRDISDWADLSETMSDLSNFADAIIDKALAICYNWQAKRYGTPYCSNGLRQYMVVIGMGKLGGRELNFSSDVDLIFTYPEAGQITDGENSISSDEFFIILCRQLIKVIGMITSEGFVFRTDMRLRPYGDGGPLALSFDAIEKYYQHQGREWERYAWIKARIIAGDKKAGARLLKALKPFVYRRYLDYGVFESLRSMKQSISAEIKRKEVKNNIKLGKGGIREIEFFGQVFQLIRGGIVPELQEKSILKVLKILAEKKYILINIAKDLENAYIFLRNTENRLQEFSDMQTHVLPTDILEKKRLAVSMNYKSWDSFASQLKQHMQNVHSHFSDLLTADTSNKPELQLENKLKSVWLNLTDEDEKIKILSETGYKNDAKKIINLLDYLRTNHETLALSNEGRTRLDKLMPKVIKKVAGCDKPLTAFTRILDLIKTIERRTCYLALLLENPAALTHIVKLSDISSWIIKLISKYPILLDELLDPRTLYAPPDKSALETDLCQQIDRLHVFDFENQMDTLRIFKQVNLFRVAAADTTEAIPTMRVSDHLTWTAETILDKALDMAWDYLVEKHGHPVCFLDGQKCSRGFAVIAYGKFGGYELGYSSDLDLVFLHAGSNGQTAGVDHPVDNAYFFARLGQRVIHILSSNTSAGIAYEVDMRLRPSGSSGLLVSHIKAFEEYQDEKAWTWEHMALIRARAVCGDKKIAKHFEQIRQKTLTRFRSEMELKKEVIKMRRKMRQENLISKKDIFDIKHGVGGMIDIEFLVQYLVLLNACKNSKLIRWSDNIRQLQSIVEAKILTKCSAKDLKDAYLTYRFAVHRLNLQGKAAYVSATIHKDLAITVKKLWDTYLF